MFFLRILWLALAVALTACARSEPDTAAPARGPAQRIVSLAPSITEMLFALGVGERVVAVTRWCDRPPAAMELPAVGDAYSVSLERIVVLEPDLIVCNAETVRERLEPVAARIPILFAATDTLEQMLASIGEVAAAVGMPERGARLRAELDREIARARERAARESEPKGRVLVVLQRAPFFVAGPGSYVDDLLSILGWPNAAASLASNWPQLSAEALIELAPDVILDVAVDAPDAESELAEVRAAAADYWARFPSIPAVEHGRIVPVAGDLIVRPGPALDEALEKLHALLARGPAPR